MSNPNSNLPLNKFVLNVYVTMLTIAYVNVCTHRRNEMHSIEHKNRPAISAAFLNISIRLQTPYAYACAGAVTFTQFWRTYSVNFRSVRDVLLIFEWQFINIQHNTTLNIVNLRYDLLLSTILGIFQSTKTTRVIEIEVIISDVINVKQTLSEIGFVRKKYLIVWYVFMLYKR